MLLATCALAAACSGPAGDDDDRVRVAVTESSRLDAGLQRPGQLTCVSDEDTSCGTELSQPAKRECPESAPAENDECLYASQTCTYAGPCGTRGFECIGARGARWTLMSGSRDGCVADAGNGRVSGAAQAQTVPRCASRTRKFQVILG